MSLMILFNTKADPSNAAHLHAADCKMLNSANGRNRVVIEATQDEIDDLNEREFPVRKCKCVKDLCGLVISQNGAAK